MNLVNRAAVLLPITSRYSSLGSFQSSGFAFTRALSNQKPAISSAPSTSTLLKVDWLLQKITPLVLKSNVRDFIDICKEDVQFDDRIFSKKLNGRTQLMSHIAKVRMYYRYLSPFNKVEWIGSCVYENEDVIVVLWRLTTLDSSFMTYFPSFITKKENKMIVKEGALDVRIDQSGHVLQIVNRAITASDREGAKSLAKLKEQQYQEEVRNEEKEMRKEFDRQYHS
ncbi:hypothetical protein GCK72_005785 [Caenorhabditis remanei]|uniref:Uncharacterized protein n=1 Tax=Caenorhabditis remanei TaxID=31234 RepID=A0A6A5HIL8_CAERE|nr:hypothetical protein GCK72_005785 [Caenorhabditis remanei]KAF1765832.1 hypothetical protein GCK72_005785 [Caenorhabditis remanei]